MNARDFIAELKAEEAQRQARGMSPQARHSLRRRIAGGSQSPRTGWAFRIAVGAVAVAALVVTGWWQSRPAPMGGQVGGFELTARSDAFRPVARGDGAVEVDAGEGNLVDRASGIALRVEGSARLRRERSGVRVERGTFHIEVQHRAPGQSPAVVFVTGGAIEVMGTRFTVVESGAGGTVTLHDGAIRFRWDDGTLQQLRPGESLQWPRRSPSASPQSSLGAGPAGALRAEELSPSGAPTRALSPSGEAGSGDTARSPPALAGVDLRDSPRSPSHPARATAPPSARAGSLLDEADLLRSRGDYEAAAQLLREGLHSQPEATRERLSFELGALLSHQLHAPAQACAHWRWHLSQFGAGRYAAEVARERKTLGCR